MDDRRRQALAGLARALAGVAELRQRRADGGRWPLPADLAVHLFLYANGWIPPTRPDPGER